MIALKRSRADVSVNETNPPIAVQHVLLGFWRQLAVFTALAALTLTMQWWSGAYAVERGAYSDEAAHFLNGLLLREYVTDGLGTSPVRFAEDFYLSYPKIAPGAWPPLFHILLGVFLLPGWPPHTAALVLIALVTAYAAWRLSALVATFAPRRAAFAIAALFALTPLVLNLTATVMVDLLLAALMLDAAAALARYWSTGRLRDAILFGVAAACCCLTKGNGVAVVLMPALLILITRRFSLLRQPGLYVAALIVVVLAVPPLLFSYRLAWSVEDFGGLGPRVLVSRLGTYLGFLRAQLGWLPVSLAGIGLAAAVIQGRQGTSRPPVAPALASLACAVVLFHLTYQFISDRYAVTAVAPLLGLIPCGIAAIVRVLPVSMPNLAAGLYVLTAVTFLLPSSLQAPRQPLGYRAAASFLDSRGAVAGHRLLIVSDEHGEGAFVSEIAVKHPKPVVTVVRASKLLSAGDWVGNNFELVFSSPAAVTKKLEDLHVAYVLVDASPGDASPPYWRAVRNQMVQAIALAPDRYEAVFSVTPASGVYQRDITVYRLRYQTPGAAEPLRLDLRNSLGRVLER